MRLRDEAHANVCVTEKLMSDADESAKLDVYCEPEIIDPAAEP